MAIETILANTLVSFSASWSVQKSTSLPAAVISAGSNPRAVINYELGTDEGQCNQIIQQDFTIAASSAINPVLTSAFTNVLGEAAAPLTAIKEIRVELLNTDQLSTVANASSITLGAGAGNPWIAGPFGATDTYTILSGGMWHHQEVSAAGLATAASKLLKIQNNDATNIATVRITIFGLR